MIWSLIYELGDAGYMLDTFVAETNAACSRGSADTHTHNATARQRDAERHNIFSAG